MPMKAKTAIIQRLAARGLYLMRTEILPNGSWAKVRNDAHGRIHPAAASWWHAGMAFLIQATTVGQGMLPMSVEPRLYKLRQLLGASMRDACLMCRYRS